MLLWGNPSFPVWRDDITQKILSKLFTFGRLDHLLHRATSCIFNFWKMYLGRIWLTQFWTHALQKKEEKKKKKKMFGYEKKTQPGKRALCRHRQPQPAVTSFFRFPLPTSSFMQLLIFLSCPVRAEHSGLLCSLVVSSVPPPHHSFPTTNLIFTFPF